MADIEEHVKKITQQVRGLLRSLEESALSVARTFDEAKRVREEVKKPKPRKELKVVPKKEKKDGQTVSGKTR